MDCPLVFLVNLEVLEPPIYAVGNVVGWWCLHYVISAFGDPALCGVHYH